MSNNLYRFDRGAYGADADYRPLGQVMRDAERVRSQEAGRLIGATFRRLAGLFRAKPAAAAAATTEFRKAA